MGQVPVQLQIVGRLKHASGAASQPQVGEQPLQQQRAMRERYFLVVPLCHFHSDFMSFQTSVSSDSSICCLHHWRFFCSCCS